MYTVKIAKMTPNSAIQIPGILDLQLGASHPRKNHGAKDSTFDQRTHRKYVAGQKAISSPTATNAADRTISTKQLKTKERMAVHNLLATRLQGFRLLVPREYLRLAQ
jgi:hypothetical protein